jgi:serine protease DegS
MPISKLSRFLLQAVTAGIAAAVVVLFLLPDNGAEQPPRPVIEVRHAGERVAADPGLGPVSYADAVRKAAPSVVNIFTSKQVSERRHPIIDDPLFQRFFGDQFAQPRQRTQTSLGSGVIISTEGYVLTNYHVIEDADEIEMLTADGRPVQASLVGADPETDLAVLRVENGDLPTITVGASADLEVGDVVLAIGNPFGVGKTVTQGIVSATGRNRLGINTFEDFIQTDAAINPGNSGGALVNAYGDLVGINTAIFSQSGGSLGIGFAIPIDLARDVMMQIVEHGRVVRGWLGIEVQDLSPQLVESFGLESTRGVVVAGVLRGGPAHQAGIQPGDVITTINDAEIEDARAALNAISRVRPGDRLAITGIREGEGFEADAEVTERPSAGP